MEKVALFPLTHVYQLTFESDGAWGVWSQHLPNIIYVMKFSFTKISCCRCEWALQGNMYKHQIVREHAQTLFKRVSFITIEHGMDHIVKGWVTCLWTHDIFQMIWNPMMMVKMSILKVMMGSCSSMSSSPYGAQ
jgi:hypothetical protein